MNETNPPEPLAPTYPLNDPGESLLLYGGTIPVLIEDQTVGTVEELGKGNVYFQLLPRPQVSWEGIIVSPEQGSMKHTFCPKKLDVSNFDFGWLTVPPEPAQESAMPNQLGSTSIACPRQVEWEPIKIGNPDGLEEVRFNLINFPFQKGNARVQRNPAVGDWGIALERFDLQDLDGWEVSIDPREDFPRMWAKAKEQASYVITHIGRMRRVDRSTFHFDDAEDLLRMLHWCLSFMASRRVGVVLPIGYNDAGAPVFVSWASSVTQTGKRPHRWYKQSWSDASSLFQSFRDLWQDTYWRRVVQQVIYAYTYAQEGTRGDLMMAQSGLETLAWAVLVKDEEKGTAVACPKPGLSKSEFKNLPAAAKVRRLLEWACIPTDSPSAPDVLGPSAPELLNEKCPSCQDGPAAVTWARNRITHPNPGDRRLTAEMLLESAWVLRGYLEVLLLRLFDYHGYYADRMERYSPKYGTFGNREGPPQGCDVRAVPWATATRPLE